MANRSSKKKQQQKSMYNWDILIAYTLIVIGVFFIGYILGHSTQRIIYQVTKCDGYLGGIWTETNLSCPVNISNLVAKSSDGNDTYELKCENNHVWIKIPSAEDYKVTNFYLYYRLEEK